MSNSDRSSNKTFTSQTMGRQDKIDPSSSFKHPLLVPTGYPRETNTKLRSSGRPWASSRTQVLAVVAVVVGCVLLCCCCCVCVALTIHTQAAMNLMEGQMNHLANQFMNLSRTCQSRDLRTIQSRNISNNRSQDAGAFHDHNSTSYQSQEYWDQKKYSSPDRGGTEIYSVPDIVSRAKRTVNGHSSVHLVGRQGHETVGELTVFKWNHHNLTRSRRLQGLELVPNPLDINAIKVLQHGLYLVYSQVAVNGVANWSVHYMCSHTTQLRRANTWSMLVSSLLTQDERGEAYSRFRDNTGMRPLDTQLQMGVFYLLQNDQVAVAVPSYCHHVRYSDAGSSYFGITKLA